MTTLELRAVGLTERAALETAAYRWSLMEALCDECDLLVLAQPSVQEIGRVWDRHGVGVPRGPVPTVMDVSVTRRGMLGLG